MPRLTRLYVRAALVYLILGFSLGALLLANKGLPLHPALWAWLPAHIEFLLMGWIVQFALGIAFWIVPRFWRPPRRGNVTGVSVYQRLPEVDQRLAFVAEKTRAADQLLHFGRRRVGVVASRWVASE